METATSAGPVPTDLVGIREAARQLSKNPSTISRQVAAGIIPNWGTLAEPKVSMAEARDARKRNLAPAQTAAAVPVTGFAAHRGEHERIKVEKAAIELAKLRGELIAKADVTDFIATAGAILRDALTRRWRTLAVELAGLTAREIEEKGLAADEAALTALAAEFDRHVDPAPAI